MDAQTTDFSLEVQGAKGFGPAGARLFRAFFVRQSRRNGKNVRADPGRLIFVLAALLQLAGAYATYAGFSAGESMRSMHSGEKR